MADSLTTSTGGGAPVSDQAPTDIGINLPGLDPKTLKPKRRAVSDSAHLFTILRTLEMARRAQNEKNGRIQAKLNSERPFSEDQLKSEGLGYKSNFSTKPLSTTAAKVAARLTKVVQASRYLTSSELPDSTPDAKKKTELFRREFTNLVRRWPAWYDFLNKVANEDAIFGWATVAWLDESTWRPEFFRQDRVFMPDGTGQTVDSVQVICLKQYLLPHELAAFIEDKDAAETAGWDINNTVESINTARPPTIPSTNAAPYTDARRYEDAIRESSVSLSLVGAAKQVALVHVLAVEIDGQVSHYIADVNSQKLLFEKLDRYPKIEDALALLSYEQSQTLMGSKGIGREIYEMAGVLDRARNEVVDRLQLSGKTWLTADENKVNRLRLTVLGNAVVVPKGFEPLQNVRIDPNVDDFIKLDTLMTQLLDQIAGGVTPRPPRDAERVTKAEVDLVASREEEKRDEITARFITQAAAMLSTMQRRAFSPDVSDKDAKRAREKLLQYMSPEELDELREQPALRTIEDYTQFDAQKVVLFAQEKRNDPLYDHKKLEKRAASVLFDPEFADEVLLPDNDPTVTSEQAREQMLENSLLAQGKEVPVSPRDSHIVHVEVLKQDFAQIAQAAAQGDPQALLIAENFLQHWSAHLELAMQGADKEQLRPYVQELQNVAKQIGEIQGQVQAQQAQAQAAQQQMLAAAGAPPAADPAAASLAAAHSPQLAPPPVAPGA